MHVIEKYALETGVKIGKPFVYEKFFPSAIDGDYITFQSSSHQSKQYSHWEEVINLILPKLKEHKISIAQIGDGKDFKYRHCLNFCGATTITQSAYVLKHSRLHFGIDSYASHMASYFNKKVLTLFSHVLPEHKKPYWGKGEDIMCFSPEMEEGKKPSYSYNEQIKNINKIKPERVAAGILKLLDINFNYDYETQFIGEEYDKAYVDVVPNAPPTAYAKFPLPRIRMDLEFNEEGLLPHLQNSDQCILIINNPIDMDMVRAFKKKIIAIVFIFDESTALGEENDFIQKLLTESIKCNFVSFLDEQVVNDLKLKYMDSVLIQHQKHETKEKASITDTEGLYYKSSRRILSGGKYFHSYYDYKHDNSTENHNRQILPVVDDELFWRDINYFNILKKLD